MEATKKISVGLGIVAILVVIFFGLWFLFFRSPAPIVTNTASTTTNNTQSFTTGTTQTGGTPLTNLPIDTTTTVQQKIFKISDGPVMAATFIQITSPTTTLARYTMQDSGHVLDLPVSVPGAIARAVSNTTIPGLGSAVFLPNGSGVIMQYLETGIMKTVFVGFPTATSTATSTVRVRFLPDGIVGLALAPDTSGLVYLLPSSGGVVGYSARTDGTTPVRLFTSPLAQVIVTWPTKKTILLQTKEATGVPGMIFSINASTGVTTPLVYAQSITATANPTFSKIVYQTTGQGTTRSTYAHDVVSGKDLLLPFNPFPERCIWSITASSTMYCAAPLESTSVNYLDLWHQGLANAADSIFSFDIGFGITSLLALPGGAQGGIAADIAQLAVSKDGNYLLYITRGDRSLWGVHIGR